MEVMTPQEFAEKMRGLVEKHTSYIDFFGKDTPYLDPEECHPEMDHLMCEVLIQLGYEEGVDIFRNTKKWYG